MEDLMSSVKTAAFVCQDKGGCFDCGILFSLTLIGEEKFLSIL